MTFFYDLNKKLDEIRETPSKTHGQLNERDMSRAAKGIMKYGKDGMQALRDAEAEGKPLDPVRKKYNKYDNKSVEEGMGDMIKKAGSMAKKVGGAVLDKVGHGSDADMIRDLQRKMGVPQTGMKPGSEPNPKQIKEIGDTPAGLAAVQKVGQRADRAIGDAGTGYSGSELDNPDKTYAARDRANSIVGRERIRANDKNPTRVVGGPNHGNRMEEGLPMVKGPDGKMVPKFAADGKGPNDLKKSFTDKIDNAKKEVDEMLGDVAAEAMKAALSGGQKKLDKNKNGKLDANDFAMLRKGGKQETAEDDDNNPFTSWKKPRADRPKVGSVERGHKHDIEHTATGRKVTRRVDDQGNSVGADDAGDTEPQKRGRGRPAGTGSKMGAKGPSGRSKLMTKENDFDPAEKGEYDQEGDMAKDSIKTVVRHAQALEKILGDDDNLPEWVQSKLAKIESMMTAVDDYMQNQEGDSEEMAMGEESTRKRDTHAEKAGKKVTKDIEYDEKKKDGIHGKKRGSEDAKAEKAGKKVAKDIEYDEKKDSKEDKPKKVKEQGGTDTPTASSGFSYGKGIYDSMNRELEKMIAESMSVNMSDSTEGGKSLTITATDEDALKLAGLLKNAGLGGGEGMGQEMGQSEEPCGNMHEALDENNPDWPTDTVTGGKNDPYLRMNSGGLDGPKSTGQSQVPILASQEDRQHTYEEDEALRRMMEMAGMRQDSRLDEGMMDKIKVMLVPKLMKLLGPDAEKIASAVKQATGGDFTPSKENAMKVVQALGLDKAAAQGQSPQMAEGIAGNWQGKLIQSLYTLGLLGSAAVTYWGTGAGAGTGLGIASGIITSIGFLLLMFANTFFGDAPGQFGAYGKFGNKGTSAQHGLDDHGMPIRNMNVDENAVQQDNLKPWEQTMKEDAEEELEESFEQTLNRMRGIAGIKEAKKPDANKDGIPDYAQDGKGSKDLGKAKDKEKKVEESIFALTNQWTAYKG